MSCRQHARAYTKKWQPPAAFLFCFIVVIALISVYYTHLNIMWEKKELVTLRAVRSAWFCRSFFSVYVRRKGVVISMGKNTWQTLYTIIWCSPFDNLVRHINFVYVKSVYTVHSGEKWKTKSKRIGRRSPEIPIQHKYSFELSQIGSFSSSLQKRDWESR